MNPRLLIQHMKTSSFFIRLFLAALLGSMVPVAHAATYVVSIGNYYFNPTNITINTGDSITWSNTALTAHDSTQQTNLWASPGLFQGQTFTFQFTNKGYYAYFCTLHIVSHPEQTGTVLVVSAPLSPTVAITNPAANSVFQAPATLTIGATASENGGTVTNVQFLVNGSSIGNDSTAPYSATASGLAAGSYTLTAVASDGSGLKATNSLSISVTNPPPTAVTLLNPSFNHGGFAFSFATQAGYTYDSQVVSPLSTSNNWLTFQSLAGNGSVLRVTNSNATNSAAFYRVRAH